MMIGIAGCGKTTYAKLNFPHYKYVSLDKVKNREKEYQILEDFLQKGDSIVIDDTNLTKYIRAGHFIRIKKYQHRIIGIYFDYSMHKIRTQNSNREKIVPENTIFAMKNQLEPPSDDEGFDKIIQIKEN